MSQTTLSGKTVKLPGYQPVGRPDENEETQWWRQWIVEIVFSLLYEKQQIYKKMGWDLPLTKLKIHQSEIYREKRRRVAFLKEEKLWGRCDRYPYMKDHGHNWIERRVNEAASEKFGPRTEDGKLKIVNSTKGYYTINPCLVQSKET